MFKVLLLFATILVAAFAAPTTDDDSNWRVVGGSNAAVNEAPYQVSLRTISNSHFCGGSIVNSRTIVTAAHCVTGITAPFTRVVVGSIYLNSGGTQYSVSRITIHASYDANTIVNDIAVVITSTAITASAGVASIALSSAFTGVGVSVKLTGWGTTSNPGTAPNTLQKITLTTISDADCKSRLTPVGGITFATQVCTLTKAGEGTCYGDSGGPLVSGTSLVGIVSWGLPCAMGYPDVFSRVSSYISWINSNAQT